MVSGGHTHLVVVEDYGKYKILDSTRDDAAGEAFDKVARAIVWDTREDQRLINYPKKEMQEAISFPRAHIAESVYDFSFSG